MKVIAYKYKVYSQNRNHQKRLEGLLHTAANVYNHSLALYKRYYKLYKKTLPKNKLQSHLAKMKQRCYHRWKIVDAMAIQQITDRIYNGYSKFFRKITKRPPSFKSYRKYKSVTYKSHGWKLNGNTLTISNLKLKLKFHLSRPIVGKIQHICLKRDSVGDWWLSFSVRQESYVNPPKPMTGKSAGFDFGLKHFLVSNEGEIIDSPRHLFHSIKKLQYLSRAYSRKKKRSNNQEKARIEIARLHRRISNLHSSFNWELSNKLVSLYDILCFETLDIQSLKKRYGQKIIDYAFSQFITILSFLCKKHRKRMIQINRWEATSKTCSVCEYTLPKLSINERSWLCPSCGVLHDRDINAAKNILRVGMSTLGEGNTIPIK